MSTTQANDFHLLLGPAMTRRKPRNDIRGDIPMTNEKIWHNMGIEIACAKLSVSARMELGLWIPSTTQAKVTFSTWHQDLKAQIWNLKKFFFGSQLPTTCKILAKRFALKAHKFWMPAKVTFARVVSTECLNVGTTAAVDQDTRSVKCCYLEHARLSIRLYITSAWKDRVSRTHWPVETQTSLVSEPVGKKTNGNNWRETQDQFSVTGTYHRSTLYLTAGNE